MLHVVEPNMYEIVLSEWFDFQTDSYESFFAYHT